MRPKDRERIFLCSRCITTDLEFINKYKDDLVVYDEFVRYMNDPSGIDTSITEGAGDFVKKKE